MRITGLAAKKKGKGKGSEVGDRWNRRERRKERRNSDWMTSFASSIDCRQALASRLTVKHWLVLRYIWGLLLVPVRSETAHKAKAGSSYREDGFHTQSSMATSSLRLHPRLLCSKKGNCNCKAQWVSRLLNPEDVANKADELTGSHKEENNINTFSFLQHTWHCC